MSFRDSCSLGLLHLGAHESPGYFCPARWPSKAVGPDEQHKQNKMMHSRAGAPEDEDLDEPEPDSDSDEDQMSC